MLSPEEALARAEQLARQYHGDQTDLAGAPYIGHLQAVSKAVNTPAEKTVAWLHDIVEDTPVTIEFLREQGFSEEILTAVDLITRRKPFKYDAYISALSHNTIARHVKIADLYHNLDISRLPADYAASDRTQRRMQVYQRAFNKLLSIDEALRYSTLG